MPACSCRPPSPGTLGLRELVDHHLDLGGAPGRANTGDKMLTLVASALGGGDCIDAADALRAGGTVGVPGCVVKAPSTLGTFLRSFRWGHVRQLDRVSRQLLARAWAAGAGPGDSPLTIDLDSTICETYGLAKEGARHHGYTGARGYHPLLAIATGTGEVLMSRLREGRANTARGAAHFLRETVGRVRYGGARGQLTVRADSGFYAHTVVAACREMDVRFSITIRQRASLRDLIEAIPEEDWTPIPYWMDGAADVAETTYTPFQTKPDAPPARLIVRRVKPTPGSQLALFARYSYHAFITDRDGETLELEADHRRHAEVENAIRDLKYGVGLNHMPSGRFAANGAWLAGQVMAHNLARWTARIGLGERTVITKTLRRRVFALVGRITRSARRLTLHLPRRWPWETQFSPEGDPITLDSTSMVVFTGDGGYTFTTVLTGYTAARDPVTAHPIAETQRLTLHNDPQLPSSGAITVTLPTGGLGPDVTVQQEVWCALRDFTGRDQLNIGEGSNFTLADTRVLVRADGTWDVGRGRHVHPRRRELHRSRR